MSPDQYLAKAEEAEKMAGDPALDVQQRNDYLEMAASWRSCAGQATNISRFTASNDGEA